ncbi:MAG: type I-E CRISPR-associated protein Cas7/Cse4/CasC [Betaproteobacteria bacterium]|nr:type I-E CRISPR-associated protein Cas7/Cse4/CasC [Betaproteobacteria bacterium]
MSARNFINFHVLISHSPSCLNRDDMNMQKTAIFGGATRVRISSQSLKRAMRTSIYYEAQLGTASIRTRSLEKLIPIFTEALQAEFEAGLVEKTMRLFVQAKSAEEASEGNEESESSTEKVSGEAKKLAVAPWSLDEIRYLCRVVSEVKLSDEGLEKAKKKAATSKKGKKSKTEQECIDEAHIALIKKRLEKEKEKIAQIRAAISQTKDIALSGRMATGGLMTSVDGALAVAHAITTHAVEPPDIDWFTAVDDLTQDSSQIGAGHIDTQQFSAGVFYRYASLNLKQLQVNLGLLADMKSAETAESRAQALAIARHVLHMLATVVPSAKQQSYAAHNLADFALVSFADQPISLANAFEKPIARDRAGGFLQPSIQALREYWATINHAYSLEETALAFAAREAEKSANGGSNPGNAPVLPRVDTLRALQDWVATDGKGA